MSPSFSVIRCSFDLSYDTDYNDIQEVQVFFSETKNLNSGELKGFLSVHELARAEQLHFEEDRNTYICCHALLRLILSSRLNVEPRKISIVRERNNKPYLRGNPLYFNVSHTRKAFAFAISPGYVGIDLENVNRDVHLASFLNTSFNAGERSFIKEYRNEARNRFFLLWTRKEALLKAIGTGIVIDLKQIKVSEEINLINKLVFSVRINDHLSNDHFIYSAKVSGNFISIATARKAGIRLIKIGKENLNLYLTPAECL
jgi:4'-phosphopantetheinyl transferase